MIIILSNLLKKLLMSGFLHLQNYKTFLFKPSTNVRISVNVQRRVGMAQKAVKTAARTERLESTQNVPKVTE